MPVISAVRILWDSERIPAPIGSPQERVCICDGGLVVLPSFLSPYVPSLTRMRFI